MKKAIKTEKLSEFNVPSKLFNDYIIKRKQIIGDIINISESLSELEEIIITGKEKGFLTTLDKKPTGFLIYRENNGCFLVSHFFTEESEASGASMLSALKEEIAKIDGFFHIYFALIPELSNVSVKCPEKQGFHIFERYLMERASEPDTDYKKHNDPGLIVEKIKNDHLWELADVLMNTNSNNIDRLMRPGVFDTQWLCFLFLRQIAKSQFGIFNKDTSFVISENGKILGAGFATFKPTGEGFIPAFFVHPEHQGKGFGNALLYHIIKAIKDTGAKKISLCVTSENRKACNLYLKNGFSVMLKYYESFYYSAPPESTFPQAHLSPEGQDLIS